MFPNMVEFAFPAIALRVAFEMAEEALGIELDRRRALSGTDII